MPLASRHTRHPCSRRSGRTEPRLPSCWRSCCGQLVWDEMRAVALLAVRLQQNMLLFGADCAGPSGWQLPAETFRVQGARGCAASACFQSHPPAAHWPDYLPCGRIINCRAEAPEVAQMVAASGVLRRCAKIAIAHPNCRCASSLKQ